MAMQQRFSTKVAFLLLLVTIVNASTEELVQEQSQNVANQEIDRKAAWLVSKRNGNKNNIEEITSPTDDDNTSENELETDKRDISIDDPNSEEHDSSLPLNINTRASWRPMKRYQENSPNVNELHNSAYNRQDRASWLEINPPHSASHGMQTRATWGLVKRKPSTNAISADEASGNSAFEFERRASWRPLKRTGNEFQRRASWRPLKRLDTDMERRASWRPMKRLDSDIQRRASWRPMKRLDSDIETRASWRPMKRQDPDVERRASWRPMKRDPELFENTDMSSKMHTRANWGLVRREGVDSPPVEATHSVSEEDKRASWRPLKRSARSKRDVLSDISSLDKSLSMALNGDADTDEFIPSWQDEDENGELEERSLYESPLGHFINGRSQFTDDNSNDRESYDGDDITNRIEHSWKKLLANVRAHGQSNDPVTYNDEKRAAWLPSKRLATRMATKDLDEFHPYSQSEFDERMATRDPESRMATRHFSWLNSRMATRDLRMATRELLAQVLTDLENDIKNDDEENEIRMATRSNNYDTFHPSTGFLQTSYRDNIENDVVDDDFIPQRASRAMWLPSKNAFEGTVRTIRARQGRFSGK